MISNPYGGLSIADGSAGTLALSSTPAKVTAWNAAGGAETTSSYAVDGDPAVRPDKANSRILVNGPVGPANANGVQPAAVYMVDLDLSVVGDASIQNVVARVRKNGVAVADLTARAGVSNAGRTQLSLSGILTVYPSDNPKNIATFADPTNPPSVYGGAGGAPKTEVPIDVTLETLTSTMNVTFEAGHFTIVRMG